MRKFAKKRDWILLFALLFIMIVLSSIMYISTQNRSWAGLTAVIEKDGDVLYQIELKELREPMKITVDGAVPVTLCLCPDCAFFETAGCPDRLCVKTGKLTLPGQCAVCLPARVSLCLRGNQKETADAVTG